MATRYESALSARFQMSLKPAPDLKALRNTIVYVNRNGYVVTPECTRSLTVGYRTVLFLPVFARCKAV